MIDLESHWTMKERPIAVFNRNEEIYEENFSKLLDEFPCPDEYIKSSDFIGSDPTVKEF